MHISTVQLVVTFQQHPCQVFYRLGRLPYCPYNGSVLYTFINFKYTEYYEIKGNGNVLCKGNVSPPLLRPIYPLTYQNYENHLSLPE